MIIYKNKASGKYFIHLKDLDDNEALFVTPTYGDGKVRIKNLEFNLFHEESEEDEDEIFLKRSLINEKQLEKFKQYNEDVETYKVGKIIAFFKRMPSYKKERIRKEGGEMAEVLKLVEELIGQGWDEE
jgi:hypothetical protein